MPKAYPDIHATLGFYLRSQAVARRLSRFPLVILEVSHPFGPVFGAHPAGLGPWVRGVPFLVPLQGPQLLETDSSNRPIEKQSIHVSAVTVYAKLTQGVSTPHTLP